MTESMALSGQSILDLVTVRYTIWRHEIGLACDHSRVICRPVNPGQVEVEGADTLPRVALDLYV